MVKGKGLQTVVLGFGDRKRPKVIALKKKTSGRKVWSRSQDSVGSFDTVTVIVQ